MSARLDPDVFAILSTNLAKLESRSHFAIKLVLLLSNLNMVLRGGLHCPAEVGVYAAAVWEKIAEKAVSVWMTSVIVLSFTLACHSNDQLSCFEQSFYKWQSVCTKWYNTNTGPCILQLRILPFLMNKSALTIYCPFYKWLKFIDKKPVLN